MWKSEDETIVVLSTDEDQEYEVELACGAACGFGSLERLERGNYVIYIAWSCFCHPNSYWLEVNKKKKSSC